MGGFYVYQTYDNQYVQNDAAMWGAGGLIGPPVAGAAIDLVGIDAMPVTLAAFYVLLLAGLAFTGGKLVRSKADG